MFLTFGGIDMATIKDVAQKCGYSICTVSRALSGKGYLKEETRAQIMQAVEELNYHPNTSAVSLKTGRRQTIALMLPSLTDNYYANLEKYMELYASHKNYIIHLINTEYSFEKEQQSIEMLLKHDVAGVIISPSTARHDHIMHLQELNIPYIYLNRCFDDDIVHCLRLNNRKASYDAMKYIIKQKHQHIGAIFGKKDNTSVIEQFSGIMQALDENNLFIDTNNLLFDINPEDTDSYNAILNMLQQPNRPKAIFAYNDMTAFTIYRAAYILGLKIPEQLSVFGYDDCSMANFFTPPLSTVYVPTKRIAFEAIDFIHHYIEYGSLKELPQLDLSLVIRDSIQCITSNPKEV